MKRSRTRDEVRGPVFVIAFGGEDFELGFPL